MDRNFEMIKIAMQEFNREDYEGTKVLLSNVSNAIYEDFSGDPYFKEQGIKLINEVLFTAISSIVKNNKNEKDGEIKVLNVAIEKLLGIHNKEVECSNVLMDIPRKAIGTIITECINRLRNLLNNTDNK